MALNTVSPPRSFRTNNKYKESQKEKVVYSLVSKWASNSCQCFAGIITSCEQYVLSLQSCQHLSTTLCFPISVNGMIFTACEHSVFV